MVESPGTKLYLDYCNRKRNVAPTNNSFVSANKLCRHAQQTIAMTNFCLDSTYARNIESMHNTYRQRIPQNFHDCNTETGARDIHDAHHSDHSTFKNNNVAQQQNNNSPNDNIILDESKAGQMSRSIKWLCASILILVMLVLVLIIVEAPRGWSMIASPSPQQQTASTARGLFLTERASSSYPSTNSSVQGKLLFSSSDEHYTTAHIGDPDDQDPSNEHDDDSQADSGNSVLDDKNSDNDNQVTRNVDRLQHQNQRHRSSQKIHRDPPPDAICTTPGCVRAAAQVLNNMDSNIKPCDDFYQFACGRWISTQVIPDEKTSLSIFSQNTANLNLKLRELIERRPSDKDPAIVGQLRNMYVSCMNSTDIEARGSRPLEEMLQYFGGWPVLTHKTKEVTAVPMTAAPAPNTTTRRRRNNANRRIIRSAATNERISNNDNKEFNWLETLIKFRQRGFSHDMIIDLSIVPDVRNNKRYIIELDQSSLGLPDRAYYFKGMNDTTVSAYYNLMIESAVMLGAPIREAQRQMFEVFEFERSLANISAPREQRRNVTKLYNKMRARSLYKLAPNIDWDRYLRSLLKDDELDLDEDEVVVKVPSFLQGIDELLMITEPRIIANYMMWRIVRHSMHALSNKWRDIAHTYSMATTGRQVAEPRWEQCLGSLDGTLGTALSALYVKNHFNERSKTLALEMVDYIREEFLRILNEIDWMDEETREEARNKAKAISAYIGYPNELLRDELIEELYEGVKLSRTNFYQNLRNLRIWSTDYAFSQLRKPNKRGDWKKHARAAVVNAYYNSLENSIEFPAGILQGAFFDAERPNYMNFGAIGYVIGHEITHGFDDRGRQFDRDGNDRNWWKPKTDARFRERAQCIIDQYSNYTVTENGLHVNGLNTQGENIADNGGIKEAFRAYRRWTKDHGREPRLPGLSEYTPDQLFWISAANIWCGKFRPEVLKLRVNSGVHSPARFRIIGPLSNTPEFAQSFGCPLGSAMNPHKKCSVW